MELRRLCFTDAAAMKRLHASMNLGYELPDEFFVKVGIFDRSQLVSAVLGRKTSEAYLLLDREWKTPQERWEAVQRLIVVSAEQAKIEGISDTHIWLPPKVEKRFAKRLAEFAFVRAPWSCYTAQL